jgi:flagellar motor protein MotB
LGVPKNRISIQAYGDAMPLADNDTAEGRARNRRVALRVIRAGLLK